MLGFFAQNARWLSAGAFLAFGSSFGQTFFLSVFAGDIRAAFGLSHGEWASIYAMGTLTSAVVMLWAGGLTDRFRVNRLGPVFLVALSLSCIFMATNSVVWLLPIVIFCLRFTGQGMASHIAMVAMSRWFVANRGKAVAISALGYSVGEALLPLTFIALLGIYAWTTLWWGAAGICLGLVPILAVLLKKERSPQSIAAETEARGMNDQHWTRVQMLRHPLFWTMLPAFLGPSAFVTGFFFFQEHYATVRGISHLQFASVFPAFTAVAVVSMVITGMVLDIVGAHRLVAFHQIPIGLGFLTFSMTQSMAGLLVGIALVGISTGAYATLISAFWAEFYGTRFLGSVKSVGTSVMVLGSSLGPAILGIFLDLGRNLGHQYGWVSLYFVGTTLLMLVGVSRARPSLAQTA